MLTPTAALKQIPDDHPWWVPTDARRIVRAHELLDAGAPFGRRRPKAVKSNEPSLAERALPLPVPLTLQ